jgi:hypothetical protein
MKGEWGTTEERRASGSALAPVLQTCLHRWAHGMVFACLRQPAACGEEALLCLRIRIWSLQ